MQQLMEQSGMPSHRQHLMQRCCGLREGDVYAAYGGVYIFAAILWLWAVDGIRPSNWDVAGVAVALLGMSIIAFQPR